MFALEFRNSFDGQNNGRLTITHHPTLEHAAQARVASGDLVVDAETGKIVTDPSWLWDWEKKEPRSWARRAIEWQCAVNAFEKQTSINADACGGADEERKKRPSNEPYVAFIGCRYK